MLGVYPVCVTCYFPRGYISEDTLYTWGRALLSDEVALFTDNYLHLSLQDACVDQPSTVPQLHSFWPKGPFHGEHRHEYGRVRGAFPHPMHIGLTPVNIGSIADGPHLLYVRLDSTTVCTDARSTWA